MTSRKRWLIWSARTPAAALVTAAARAKAGRQPQCRIALLSSGTTLKQPPEVATAAMPRARPRRRLNQRDARVDVFRGPSAMKAIAVGTSKMADITQSDDVAAMPAKE